MPQGRPIKNDYSFASDKYVTAWLTGLSSTTQKNYRRQFIEVLAFTKMTPTQMIQKRVKDLTSTDLTERQSFELKFREYKAQLEETKPTHNTVLAYLKCFASFFARNGVSLNLKRGDWVSTKPQNVIKHYTPTLEEIKRLYTHAHVRDKSLLLVLAQSGFSEIDVSELKIEDLDDIYSLPETEHVFIEKPREKSTIMQATCISFETIHDLKEYLGERGNPKEGYLFASLTTEKGAQKLEVRSINEAMKSLFRRTFGAEKAKEFKTKSLRSFFNSALLRANIQPQELKDVMFGHERAGARKNYSYDKETIVEAYIHAFPFLSINGIQVKNDLTKFKTETSTTIQALSQQITERALALKSVEDANVLFQTRINKLEEDINKLEEENKKITNEHVEFLDSAKSILALIVSPDDPAHAKEIAKVLDGIEDTLKKRRQAVK
jgi:integrase